MQNYLVKGDKEEKKSIGENLFACVCGQEIFVKYFTTYKYFIYLFICEIFYNRFISKTMKGEGRQQKQEELQSYSLWNKDHIHRKIDKMKRQRAMYQLKEQDKTPEKQLNEMEIGNLPEKKFRIIIGKMIQDLGKRMEAKIEKMQELFNKDLEELKNKQTEMNNTITEMKNTLEGINSRITEAEEQISDLEYRMVEFTAADQNKEKRMKRNEDSLRDLWDNIKRTNIHIIRVPEGEKREKGPKKISEELVVENSITWERN